MRDSYMFASVSAATALMVDTVRYQVFPIVARIAIALGIGADLAETGAR